MEYDPRKFTKEFKEFDPRKFVQSVSDAHLQEIAQRGVPDPSKFAPNNSPYVIDYPEEQPHITCDRVLVVADAHIPYYDRQFTGTILPVAQAQNIRVLVIGGDLVDQDSLKSDKFPPSFYTNDFRIELALAREMITNWFSWFENIYLIRGNHDWRVMSRTDNQVRMEDLGQLIDPRLYTTDYREIIIKSGDKVWRVTHPRSYSRIAGNVAKKLAEKFHQNVMSAHGHFYCHTFDCSGKYHCIDTGGLVNSDYVDYINMGGDTTHPRWNRGYWMIKDGAPFGILPETAKFYM